MEVFFNNETKVFVEFSFNWLSWIFISIDEIPLLIEFAMLVVDDDVLLFSIFTTRYIHDFSFLIGKECSIHSEELPPSRVNSAGHSEVA
jgi:hypothetical protein